VLSLLDVPRQAQLSQRVIISQHLGRQAGRCRRMRVGVSRCERVSGCKSMSKVRCWLDLRRYEETCLPHWVLLGECGGGGWLQPCNTVLPLLYY
jgi:hypothetical protein